MTKSSSYDGCESMSTVFPQILKVQQSFDTPACKDVGLETLNTLSKLGVESRVQSGESVAITAGSRGISNLANIIKSVAQFFSDRGARPFIVPAMGSHGGGTAAGQLGVLEAYGVTEKECGCPIRSSMETVVIGEANEGFPVYFDKLAFEADHVVICNRIKPHTNFSWRHPKWTHENDDDWAREKRRGCFVPPCDS